MWLYFLGGISIPYGHRSIEGLGEAAFLLSFSLTVLEIKFRTSHVLDRYITTELHPGLNVF